MGNKDGKGKKAVRYPANMFTLYAFVRVDLDHGTIASRGKYLSKPRITHSGYRVIKLPSEVTEADRGSRKSAYYRVDHIMWWAATGEWPTGWIEHANGIRSDDAIDNLVHMDDEGLRWALPKNSIGSRYIARVDDDPTCDAPAVVIDKDGNLRPKIAGGWAQQVGGSGEVFIEPAPEYEKGEFGKDWT